MKKIIATLGPSTFNQKIVEKLDESGVDIFRINLSHTEIKDYQKLAEKISIWTKNQFVRTLKVHKYELVK